MEKSTNRKHSTPSIESKVGFRATKPRRSKSSRASRESKSSKASVPPSAQAAQQVDEADTTNCRESITNLFFHSFLETIIAERSPKHGESDVSFSSLSGVADSLTESHVSVLESAHTMESATTVSKIGSKSLKSSMASSKDTSSHKISHFSPLLVPEGSVSKENSSSTSCASHCPCNWKIAFKNGNIYEGQINGNLMHGKGTFHWTDGTIYRGDFKDGYPWGQGKLVLPDLSTYEGEFCMGFFHGHGTFNVKSTPLLFCGEWRHAERNGKGWLLYDTNNWYDGDWKNNQKHGDGYRQYANGSRYKGSWLKDLINGEGTMFWNNNDCYSGEWSDGYQNGYGEYTWGLIAHKQFIFPNYNWYKGNWINGYRSGAGIMNFGHESGAKLAGTWDSNRKHGPGLMICGNGMILQRNPLFKDDKPSAFQRTGLTSSAMSVKHIAHERSNASQTFKTISNQIKSKDNLGQINEESVMKITRSGTNIKMKQFIKLLEKNTENAPPLKIPIHNIIHEVDFSYFAHNMYREDLTSKGSDLSALEINHLLSSKTMYVLPTPSTINYLSSNYEITSHFMEGSASQHSLPNLNDLKNLIINHLPQLRNIYKTYATFCSKEDITFEPVLVRLFLWQLYRDIGVTDECGVSIVEVDELLIKNPKSCLETVHNPWEPIYFWQFLQSLVGVACLLYAHTHKVDYIPTSGFMYFMFRSFLGNRLFPNAGKFQGNCLTHLRDLVPIGTVYQLYKEVGEPHTVEEFLKNTRLKKGQGPPCYKIINSEDNDEYIVETGSNVVILNNEVSFAEQSQETVKYEENNRYEMQGLYTFTKLGRKKILKCLVKICPLIITESGRYLLHYRLSFIEFYEAILLLAYEKVEQERIKLSEDPKELTFRPSSTRRANSQASRISQQISRRKKFKK